jgi:hypothetical protein
MVYWQQFEASEWDIEYDAAKLASHGISDWEAEEGNLERLCGTTKQEGARPGSLPTLRTNGQRQADASDRPDSG